MPKGLPFIEAAGVNNGLVFLQDLQRRIQNPNLSGAAKIAALNEYRQLKTELIEVTQRLGGLKKVYDTIAEAGSPQSRELVLNKVDTYGFPR